ncbi:MAG: DUF4157 domain-containing protein [Myxococcales bacterium]|nr:DUF4157 domain-containing protein [Myxococcales bacterium]
MFDHALRDLEDAPATATRASPQVGKRSLTQSLPARIARGSAPPPSAAPVQRKGDLDAAWSLHLGDAPDVIAARGMTGAATALPHGATIQRAFGRHDVSQTPAHVGGAAAEASAALGARAYAANGAVAFADGPDLFTAAHEAAHVVQQRAGVQLAGGVGAAGDPYEQHADRVAAAVVAGASAEAILDEHTGGGATAGVQRAEATATPTAAPAPATTAAAGDPAAVTLRDLQAMGKQILAGMIASAAPQPGTSLEIEAMARVPVYPPLNLSGELAIEVEHDDQGVSVEASGGLGLSIGETGAFCDLMATSSFSGKGADATRAVEMLVLAMESYVRAIPDGVFIAAASRSIPLAMLVAFAAAHGHRPSDLIADAIWGKGHAAEAMAAMQDGEEAGFTAGGKFAGAVDEGEEGVEGSAALAGERTITKEDGQVSTKDALVLSVEGEVEVKDISGGFELEVPLTEQGAGTLTFTAGGDVDAKLAGGLGKYAAFASQAIAQVRAALTAAAPTSPEGTAKARAADGTLAAAAQALPSVINGAGELVAQALADEGLAGVEGSIGLEGEVELDLGAKQGTLRFALSRGLEVDLPGGYGDGEVSKKTELVSVPFPLGK